MMLLSFSSRPSYTPGRHWQRRPSPYCAPESRLRGLGRHGPLSMAAHCGSAMAVLVAVSRGHCACGLNTGGYSFTTPRDLTFQ